MQAADGFDVECNVWGVWQKIGHATLLIATFYEITLHQYIGLRDVARECLCSGGKKMPDRKKGRLKI
jgi:hypothetical protein